MVVCGPRLGHSHKNIGDQKGVVLSLGAPYVQDRGLNPHKIHPSLIKAFDEEFEVEKKDA